MWVSLLSSFLWRNLGVQPHIAVRATDAHEQEALRTKLRLKSIIDFHFDVAVEYASRTSAALPTRQS